ncbi:quinone oxidoreductase family protein [Planotetraspora kaengkrachanensis]|uniref:NADPH:quinone reductase n=1 Tax=Planotetraspora kaengkrachanensis TaxID=575193 RepID=A0A8J3VAG7_9ACTN|nr:zinc-binding dehydrogenase [Planotetraspora kaengkrachanensis]GIG83950.1 NADPH:quinone reductase [Planotetraspora kaengkrachanensis]
MSDVMRAAIVHACGEAPRRGERDRPERREGRTVVSVLAAPITPLDLLCASGSSYFGVPALPYVPGVQGVGHLTEDTGWGPAGTRVWFPTSAGMRPGDGSLAQYCSVPEDDLVPLPDGVGETQAAALGLSAVAAWMALTWRAAVRPGEQVLVLGAGGVVGQVAVQAARLLGARRVVAACRSDAAREAARAAGADAVVPIEAGDDAATLAGRMAAVCDGGVDVVIDPLFGVPAEAAVRVLAQGGRLVNLGGSAADSATLDSSTLRSRSAAVLGYTNNDLTKDQRRAAFSQVMEHAVEGGLKVAFDMAPLDRVSAAWSSQAAGTAIRRIVVTPWATSTPGNSGLG